MKTTRLACFAALLLPAAALPAQLAGAYTVGVAGTYANIAAAIADLTTVGVSAPVTFYVNASDTGPWTIGAFPGQGAANPVTFEAIGGPITLAGTQPVVTLSGCAWVTFRGFSGTYTATPNVILVAAGTTNCTFAGCDFRAPTATSTTTGAAVFNFTGGSGCTIEDSTFGGGYECLNIGAANSGTTVQRCRIIGGGWWIMRITGADFTLANNFITGNSNYGISAGVGAGSTVSANLRILHNTIAITHPTSGSQYCSLRWYSNANGTEVLNNIFVDNYPTLTTSIYNVWCSGTNRPRVMNNNCFWSNQTAYLPFSATGNKTLAQWQATGFDVNSIQADPEFVAPGATPPDHNLVPGSLCVIAGTTLPTVLTDHYLVPRTAPVSIGAHEEDSGPPGTYTVFGAGCAGSAGIPTNTASVRPRLGLTSVITIGSMPAPNLGIALLGFSNTMSGFGPLPLDLAGFGAPACFARVSADATMFLVGSGGSATFSITTPNAPWVIGLTIYTQALVVDAGLNALGMSISNAAAATMGL